MAFTIRAGAAANSATSFTAAVPTGGNAPVSGDAMYIVVESWNGTTDGTPSTPGGWTKLREASIGSGQNAGVTLTVFGKIAGGSESDVTITGFGDHGCGSMFVVTGHGLSTINDTVVGTANTAASSTLAAPSITVTAGSLVVLCAATTNDSATTANFASWAATDPSSLTELEDHGYATGFGGGIGYAYGTCAGTSTGTGSATTFNGRHAEVFLGLAPVVVSTSVQSVGAIPMGF